MEQYINLNDTERNMFGQINNATPFPFRNSSITNETTEAEIIEPPLYIVITATLLYIIIFLVGVVGNLLVILVIVYGRAMRTSVNMYLTNLCVADVLVILVCMPTALVDIYTKEIWYFGEFMCKFVPFLENAVANASILTIMAISFERYRVVCHPLKSIEEGSMKVVRVVVAVWIISIISSMPWLSIPQLRSSFFYDGTPIQVCRNPIVENWQKIYVVNLTVFFFLLPTIILFVLNCHLCQVLLITREYESCIHENRKERKRKQNQVANIIASIVSMFFICHLPFRVAVLWFTFENKNVIWSLGLERYLAILYSVRIMFYLNHALNPVIYNLVSTKFRGALFEVYLSVRRFGLCSLFMRYKHRMRGPIVLSTRTGITRHRQSSSDV